jgi:hypothetical protein
VRLVEIENGTITLEIYNHEAMRLAEAFELAAGAASGSMPPTHLQYREDLHELCEALTMLFEVISWSETPRRSLSTHRQECLVSDAKQMARVGETLQEAAGEEVDHAA